MTHAYIVGQALRLPRQKRETEAIVDCRASAPLAGGIVATGAVALQFYFAGAGFISTRIMCIVVVPIFSAAWVNGSR